jgi:aldehyde dehydrogenase (NAD+)
MSGPDAGELIAHPSVAGVTFTGSSAVGRTVVSRAAASWTPCQVEAGGQNAAIVLADAEIDATADAILEGAVSYSGQKCTATRRVIAVGDVADELREALAARFKHVAVGDPADESTVVGPLIDACAADAFRASVASALAAGATRIAAGKVPDAEGHFVAPTLLAADDVHAKVNQEETFGPLLTMLTVRDVDRAVEAANSTRFGLVGAVHGRDISQAAEIAGRLRCGLRRVNAPTTGVEFYAPFGGERESSFGPREQGRAAREFFTTSHTTTIVSTPRSSVVQEAVPNADGRGRAEGP